MAVPAVYHADLEMILAKRDQQGAGFWSTPDGRWGVGSPFSTFDVGLILTELGVPARDSNMQGIAATLLNLWQPDGRIRPAPKGSVYPCHTANAARVLARLGFTNDARMKATFNYLLDQRHTDGGWRCSTCKLGKSEKTDASNPGVTLAALDALRFTARTRNDERVNTAVETLLSHWTTRAPLGPCRFGIGSRFLRVEYPFLRYNLFFYVYVLSHYDAARGDPRFRNALATLQSKLAKGQIVVEAPNRGLARLAFCRKGEPSKAATKRYREILKNLE